MTTEQFLAWQTVFDALAKLDRNNANPLAQLVLLQRIRKLRALDPHFTARVDSTCPAEYSATKERDT